MCVPPAHRGGTGTHARSTRFAAALLVFGVAVFYQWSHPSFTNDHFEILAKAQRVLDGELPIRDFFDNGRPLAIGLSAASLKLSHGSLLGEAVLTMGAIALGIALLFLLTVDLTGSWVLAGWAALCLMTIEPRLYNYGKVFIAMTGVGLAFRYVDRPTIGRAAAVGAFGALGFLWRHDFGVYLGVLATALFAPGLVSRPRDTCRHAATSIGVAVVIAAPYFLYLWHLHALATTAAGAGAGFIEAAQLTWRPFTRSRGVESWRENGETWVYDAFVLAPVAAAVVLRRRQVPPAVLHKIAALALFSLVLVLFLIRGNLDSRLPDVAGPAFLLLAWLLSTFRPSAPGRIAAAALAVATFAAVVMMVGENPARRLLRETIHLPESVTSAWTALRGDPVVWWETDGLTDTRAVARWLRECTSPSDRVLIFGYYPDVVFFSKRGFAGGQVFLHSGYYSSPAEQALTVQRMARQSVPFVVVEREDAPALRGTYADVGAFILANYTAVTTSDFRGPHSFTIYERNGVTSSWRAGLPCVP